MATKLLMEIKSILQKNTNNTVGSKFIKICKRPLKVLESQLDEIKDQIRQFLKNSVVRDANVN